MATVEELEQKVAELETRLVALERSMFSERYGAVETRDTRTVPPISSVH